MDTFNLSNEEAKNIDFSYQSSEEKLKDEVEKFKNNCKFLRETLKLTEEDIKEFWKGKSRSYEWTEGFLK